MKSTVRTCCALVIYCLYSVFFTAFPGIAGEHLLIEQIVRSVSPENLRTLVSDLQENRDLNFPDKSYRSRYSLRVRDTDNPSDGACDNAADYIFDKFASYGLDVEYDPFIHEMEREYHKGSYRMRNVIATMPGKGPGRDKTYIICAHYDSIAGLQTGWLWGWKALPAPGADDNASGTAAVLEAARILSRYDFNFTIKFIAFSGEELGMFGSKHYAQAAAASDDQIAGVINLDMIAYDPDELDIDIVTNEDSQWLSNAIYRVGDIYNIGITTNKIIDPEMVFSDHSSFWKTGYSAVLIVEGSDKRSDEYSPFNHTPDDTIEKLNFELVSRTARLAIATIAQLADPITGPDELANPDLMVEADTLRSSHVPYRPGESVTITANIRNLGPGDVEDISVQMWLVPPVTGSHSEMVEQWTLDLQKGASYQVSAPVTLDEWGDYQIIIRVNPDLRVFESDFSNNLARKTIFVSAELGVADLIAYPNPAILNEKSEVNLVYKLSQDASVIMEIYDILGQLVYSERFVPGENGGKRGPNNSVEWNGLNQNLNPVASGIYICRIAATNDSGETRGAFKKMAVIR